MSENQETQYWVVNGYDKEKIKYCIENSVFIMQYQYGEQNQGTVTKILDKVTKISPGDKVILYNKNKYYACGIFTEPKLKPDIRTSLEEQINGRIKQESGKIVFYTDALCYFEDLSDKNGFEGEWGQRLAVEKWENINNEGIEIKGILSHIHTSGFMQDTINELKDEIFYNQVESLLNGKAGDNMPQNIIFYGPPGTGKTYELLSNWLPKYESENKGSNDLINEFLSESFWWLVIAYVMCDLGEKKAHQVKDINEHPVLQKKASLSNNKSIRPTIWSCLQTYAIGDSRTVNYKYKGQFPQIFDKKDDSSWHLIDGWRDIIPEFSEQIDNIRNGKDGDEKIRRYEFITFHQSYSYEEFIEGLRPVVEEGSDQITYKVKPGVFKRICDRAKLDPQNRYAIFIDEINRGNISKIFGELITLIEPDKRVRYDNEGKRKKDDNGLELTLPYSGNSFGIPANLDIICTMNTADRSIALLDTALRRRFDFREMMPDYETIKGNDNNGKISEHDIDLRKLLKTMNERIRILVGRDLQLGHSFFCSVKTLSDLQKCFSNKIIPLLQEYFYGNWERIRLVLGDSGKKEDICFIQSKNFNKNILSEFEEPEIKDFYVNPKLNELSAEAFRKIYLEPENAATEANS